MATRTFGATLFSLAVMAALPGTAHAIRVEYTLSMGVERNDNLLLTPTDRIGVTMLRPGIAFSVLQDSSTVQAEFSGRAEYLDYRDNRFDNTYEGTLSGRLNWVLVPERLSFTVEDDLTVQPVNTLLADVPGNRQQVNVFSAGPTLLFNWTQTLRGAAELRYINSDAEVTDEFNSDRINFALRATKELSEVSRLSGNLQVQRVDFERDLVARDYDRTDVFGRYARTLANFDVAIDAGLSRINYTRGGGSRSEPLFRVETTWRRNDRHRLTLRASSQFSDTAADALAGIGTDLDMSVPGAVPIGESVVNASPYEERGLEALYTFTTPRLTVIVAPYHNRLRYVDTDAFDQNTSGGRFDANWLARPRLRLGAYGATGRVSYLQLDRADETREAGLYAEYEFTRRLSSRLTVARYERDISLAGLDAKQNSVLFTIAYSNR